MKKIFSEAEVELTLLSALDDILFESLVEGDPSDFGDAEPDWGQD